MSSLRLSHSSPASRTSYSSNAAQDCQADDKFQATFSSIAHQLADQNQAEQQPQPQLQLPGGFESNPSAATMMQNQQQQTFFENFPSATSSFCFMNQDMPNAAVSSIVMNQGMHTQHQQQIDPNKQLRQMNGYFVRLSSGGNNVSDRTLRDMAESSCSTTPPTNDETWGTSMEHDTFSSSPIVSSSSGHATDTIEQGESEFAQEIGADESFFGLANSDPIVDQEFDD